ncbi:MAG: S9 family peptidase [Acidiphilium sp. 34-60-192]|nr:MAG: S9 family peptidase [Acidiphilium sp. 34-60-192]
MITAPQAKRERVELTQLGRVRVDDYAWMKDPDWQKVLRDPSVLRADIRDYLNAENAYTETVLGGTATLQATLRAEMEARIDPDDRSPPMPDGAWSYYYRYAPGAEHPIYARTPRAGGAEQILLDANLRAVGQDYFKIIAAVHSPDHRLFAFAEDVQGSEVYRVWVMEIASGAMIGPAIEACTGDFCWSPCSQHIFWIYRDDHGRPTRVMRRVVGRDFDHLVYQEWDPGFFIGVNAASSGRAIFIQCGNQETSEAWFIPGESPDAAPLLIEARREGVRYEVADWGGRLIIRTNDGADDFRLMEAGYAQPGRAHWRDVLAHEAGRFIVDMVAFADYVAVLVRVNANTEILLLQRDGTVRRVGFDEPAYVVRIEDGFEFATQTLRFRYSSLTTPTQWFDYDMASGARVLVKAQKIPSGHDPADYVTVRLESVARDGARVPVTLLHRRDVSPDGAAPILLYGYGAYGIPTDPGFRANVLSLVDRGFVYVIAHIRGGTERGWNWFLAARGQTKAVSFTDFIDVAEDLIGRGMARAQRIVGMGGSAGGLLMGAVLTMRPDLWAGIIAAVPFVDVLNTMSDDSLPLTPPEWPEWGNPLRDEAAYDAIAAYSPYDNIRPLPYPAVLATGGLSDPRVTYWEPAKFVAKLRAASTGTQPILLHMEMSAGHGGSAGRFDALKQVALTYAFSLWAVGLSDG